MPMKITPADDEQDEKAPEATTPAADPLARLLALRSEESDLKIALRAELLRLDERRATIIEQLGPEGAEPEPPKKERTEDVQPRILAFMEGRPGRNLNPALVAAGTGMAIESVRSGLSRLARAGKIQKGTARGEYVLPEAPPQEA